MYQQKSPSPVRILTVQERRQQRRDEMLSAILESARAIMREEGVGALNLHEIARRVGLRTSSLYVYFPGRMAIYDAVYRMGVRLYRAEIRQALQILEDPWETLHGTLARCMRLSLGNPELFQIVFGRPVPGFHPSEESKAEARRMTAELSLLLKRVMPTNKSEPSRDLPATHGLMLAMIYGLTALHIANEPDLPIGTGRFGSLIPDAVALFKAAWGGAPFYPSSPDESFDVGR